MCPFRLLWVLGGDGFFTGLGRPGVTYHPWQAPPSLLRKPAACAGGSCSCSRTGAVQPPAPFDCSVRRLPGPCPSPTGFFTAARPFDAVFARLSRIISGRLNVTRSVQKPVRNHAANRSPGADVRRRHCLLFGSRSWSTAGSGPCQGVALSEELLGHAGGSPGGTDAFGGREDRQLPAGRDFPQHTRKIYQILLNLSNFLQRIFGAGILPARPWREGLPLVGRSPPGPPRFRRGQP